MWAKLLQWDNLIHFSIGGLLAGWTFSLLGVFSIPLLIWLLFGAREAEQEAAQGGWRWRPWTWSLHRHIEWHIGGLGALAALLYLIYWSS